MPQIANKKGPMKAPAKVAKVMGEFKTGALKTNAGKPVTDRKQAVAIGYSEARRGKKK